MKKIGQIILLVCSSMLIAGCGNKQEEKKDEFDDLKTVRVRPDVLDKLTLEPINAYDITTKEELEAFNGNSDNVILTIDKSLSIVDKNNKRIKKLSDINYADLSSIFCFRINDTETAEAFCDSVNEMSSENQDFTIFSSNLEVLDVVKNPDSCPFLRTVYDVTNKTDIDYDVIRKTANSHLVNVLLISQSQIDSESIRKTQILGKTVWVYCDDQSEADVYTCLVSGADGIVTKRINFYMTCFNHMGSVQDRIAMRTQINVAHRGLPHVYAENTIAACKAAIKGGAEALELDFQKTKDDEIIVMHDTSVNRVINDDGDTKYVADLTSEEISEMRVVKGLNGEDVEPQPIPFIEDVIDLMHENPDIILFAEIKDTDPAFCPLFIKAFEDGGVIDRVLILHFESLPIRNNMYGECRKYNDEIWGTNLLFAPLTYLTSIRFCMNNNCGYNSNIGVTDIWGPNYIPYMQKRGLMSYFWTLIDDRDSIPDLYSRDIFAMTNNWADEYAKLIKNVSYDGVFSLPEKDLNTLINKEYNVNVETYDGTISSSKAVVKYVDNNDVILSTFVCGYQRYLRAEVVVSK